jgi:HSP20 family protein
MAGVVLVIGYYVSNLVYDFPVLTVTLPKYGTGTPFENGNSSKILRQLKIQTMTLVKLNNQLPRTFNHLFQDFFNELPAVAGKDWSNLPPVNIVESKDAYELELSVPGRNKEDFHVNVEKGLLTISFEKKEEVKNEDIKTVRKEFGYQSFKRSFSLDDKIDTEKIQAKYENGILKFLLPKKELAKDTTKQISVQ